MLPSGLHSRGGVPAGTEVHRPRAASSMAGRVRGTGSTAGRLHEGPGLRLSPCSGLKSPTTCAT